MARKTGASRTEAGARPLVAAGYMLAITVIGGPTLAAESGQSPYLNGYRSFLAGVIPPAPGVYVANDTIFYHGTISSVVLSGRAQAGVRADLMGDILAPTYVSKSKLLGGTYAASVAVSVLQVDVDAGLRTPNRIFFTHDDKVGLGDVIVAPLILGWHFGGHIFANVSVSAIVPLGTYNVDDLANSGRNFWTLLPQAAVSYFDPKSGWDASLAFSYVATTRNKATDYDTGDILHLEGAIGKQFGKAKVGVAGYAMRQISDDTGSGAVLGAFRSRVYGVGPALQYTFGESIPIQVTLKWAREFDAKNSLQGDSIMLNAGFKF